jgi:hypothetical protein
VKDEEINSINSNFIKSWNINSESIQILKPNEKLKVLRIVNLADNFDELRTKKFQDFLAKLPHLFVVIIEASTEELAIDFSEFLYCSRPLILQIQKTQNKSAEVYYKDDKSNAFSKVKLLKINALMINTECFKSNCNFQTLLSGLAEQMATCFDGDLLNLRVNLTDVKCFILIAQSAAQLNVLSFRFLQLFMPCNENLCDYVSIADLMQFNGAGTLRAALELPFEDYQGCQLKLNRWQLIKLQQQNDLGDNLLIIEAVRRNNVMALEFLLSQNINISQNSNYAKLAWTFKHYNALHVLLSKDSPFFDSFDLNQMEQQDSKELKQLLINRQRFFESIEMGLKDEVQGFIEENQQLKVAYNQKNKSAVAVAFESKEFTIYLLLLAQGFTSGIDDFDFLAAEDQLSSKHKVDLRNAKREYFQSPDDHYIFYLIAKSKLGLKDTNRQKNFDTIRKFYEEINKTSKGKLVLRLLEEFDRLEIVFDFNQTHIKDIEPTANIKTVGKTLRGYKGWIYIAAGGEDRNDIMGVICHESVHFIMEMFYENSAMPF